MDLGRGECGIRLEDVGPAEHFIHYNPQAVDIRIVTQGLLPDPLRRDIAGRSHEFMGRGLGTGNRIAGRIGKQLGDPEIQELDEQFIRPGDQEDVLRLHVPVKDLGGMHRFQRIAELHGDGSHAGPGETRPFQHRGQVYTIQEFHDQAIERLCMLFGNEAVDVADDIRMVQATEHLDFVQKAQEEDFIRNMMGMKYLYGNRFFRIRARGTVQHAHVGFLQGL